MEKNFVRRKVSITDQSNAKQALLDWFHGVEINIKRNLSFEQRWDSFP